MGLIEGMWLVLLGLTGVASFVFRDAKNRVLVLCLIQFGVGGWATLLGWPRVWVSMTSLAWFGRAPVYWCTTAAHGVVELLLGLLLLAGMTLTLMIGRDENTRRTSWRRKVAIAQLAMGVLALALGAWTAVFGFASTVL